MKGYLSNRQEGATTETCLFSLMVEHANVGLGGTLLACRTIMMSIQKGCLAEGP